MADTWERLDSERDQPCALCHKMVHRTKWRHSGEEFWGRWQDFYARDWCRSSPYDLGPHVAVR